MSVPTPEAGLLVLGASATGGGDTALIILGLLISGGVIKALLDAFLNRKKTPLEYDELLQKIRGEMAGDIFQGQTVLRAELADYRTQLAESREQIRVLTRDLNAAHEQIRKLQEGGGGGEDLRERLAREEEARRRIELELAAERAKAAAAEAALALLTARVQPDAAE